MRSLPPTTRGSYGKRWQLPLWGPVFCPRLLAIAKLSESGHQTLLLRPTSSRGNPESVDCPTAFIAVCLPPVLFRLPFDPNQPSSPIPGDRERDSGPA